MKDPLETSPAPNNTKPLLINPGWKITNAIPFYFPSSEVVLGSAGKILRGVFWPNLVGAFEVVLDGSPMQKLRGGGCHVPPLTYLLFEI